MIDLPSLPSRYLAAIVKNRLEKIVLRDAFDQQPDQIGR
jgi:hypothetical protein